MASIKELIQSIESGDSSFDEKLAAINQMEETLIAMRNNEEQAVNDNVELIVEAIKVMEKKVNDQLEIAKSIVPEKGDKGDRGIDGAPGRDGVNGRDGRDGKDGQNGQDGADGVSVTDAKIDFDGSLIITLSTGKEINVGEVVASDLAEKIKVISTMSTNTAIADITGGTINNTVIGGTTPAAGTFTTLIGGGGSSNYGQLTGGATTKAVEFKTLGSDTNVALAIRTQGTGAIDLAAGSRGVNISNGGTVTAITRTAGGSAYTSIPTVAITAPTTSGGVQATASVGSMFTNTATVQSGGTGYTNGDVLTIVGGTVITSAATYTVTGVSGGAVTSVTPLNFNQYSVLPTNPVSTTGGTGSGATLNLTYGIGTVAFTITNAGSGYVEQPTVTFSGGGGSGAAAYATVGSIARLTSIGSGLEVAAASGIGFRVANSGTANVNYYSAQGNSSGGSVLLAATGTDTDISSAVSSKGAGSVRFQTNNAAQEQMRVAHTASAVNYVQVTGAATNNSPTISSQGSDLHSSINLIPKGNGNANSGAGIILLGSDSLTQFRTAAISATSGNTFLEVQRANGFVNLKAVTGSANGDIALTPQGTGNVRFGTYTGTISAITGYIEIKDSGGTIRRLAVVA
jgi:hypothetical protein